MAVTDAAVTLLVLLIISYHSAIKQGEAFQMCAKSSPSTNSTLHFVNHRDLVPEVHGCVSQTLGFQCCMSGYRHVQWFQRRKNGSWVDFMDVGFERALGWDDNQTAILKNPWDHDLDNGTYRCVGYGATPADIIQHTLNVSLKACPNIESSAPIPFIPEKMDTNFTIGQSENASIACGAIFGTQCDNAVDNSSLWCTFRWVKVKVGDHEGEEEEGEEEEKEEEEIPEGEANSTLRVFFEKSGTASSVNDLVSNLHIHDFTESDYGTYKCTMENKLGTATRNIILVKKRVIVNRIVQNLVIGMSCVAFVFLVSIGLSYRRRMEIRIRLNVFKQRFNPDPFRGMKNDVLLLHTSSVTIDSSFAKYFKNKLELHNYQVIIEHDINGGQDMISEWLKKSRISRCVVVFLTPDFISDEDQICRLSLQNIVLYKVNIIFILFQVEFQTETWFCCQNESLVFVKHPQTTSPVVLSEDFNAPLRLKTKITWPVDALPCSGENVPPEWERVEETRGREVGDFWKQLVSHLPQPSRLEGKSKPAQRETDPLIHIL